MLIAKYHPWIEFINSTIEYEHGQIIEYIVEHLFSELEPFLESFL